MAPSKQHKQHGKGKELVLSPIEPDHTIAPSFFSFPSFLVVGATVDAEANPPTGSFLSKRSRRRERTGKSQGVGEKPSPVGAKDEKKVDGAKPGWIYLLGPVEPNRGRRPPEACPHPPEDRHRAALPPLIQPAGRSVAGAVEEGELSPVLRFASF